MTISRRAWMAGAAAGLAMPGVLRAGSPVTRTLTFWTIEAEPERVKTFAALAQMFEWTTPDVRIDVVGVDENELARQYTLAVAEGRAPDLINANVETLMRVDRVTQLDSDAHAEVLERFGADEFIPAAVDTARLDDRMVAVPYHGWVQGAWLRRDWFDHQGIDVPSDWTGIARAAQAFHMPASNRYGLLLGTGNDAYAEQCFSHIALSIGQPTRWDGRRLMLEREVITEALALHRSLAAFAPPGVAVARDYPLYLRGQAAMIVYSTFMLNNIARASLLRETAVPDMLNMTRFVPDLSERRMARYGEVIGIALRAGLSADRRQAGLAFLSYLLSPGPYATVVHMAPGGYIPVLRNAFFSKRFQEDPKGILARLTPEQVILATKAFGRIATLERPAATPHQHRPILAGRQIIGTMVAGVMAQRFSPREAVAWGQQAIDALPP